MMHDIEPCADGHKYPITECPHMKEREGDTSMEYEYYVCTKCGYTDKLDYEEMK